MDAVRQDMAEVEVMEEDAEVGPNGDGNLLYIATLGGRSRKKMKMNIY